MGNSPVWGKSFGIADLDVLVTAPMGYSNRSKLSAEGDFNGDGYDDVAVLMDSNEVGGPQGPQNIQLILGRADFPEKSNIESLVNMKIYLPSTVVSNGHLFFADINGDGKDDLFYYGFRNFGSKIYGVFGTTIPPVSLSWGPDQADLELTVNYNVQDRSIMVKPGDFNGDGRDDLLVGMTNDSGGGDVYLVLGQSVFTSSSFAVNSANSALWVHSNGDGYFGKTIAIGDVDGDGKSDMVLSSPLRTRLGGVQSGEIYIIRGSTHYITPWNLDSTPADITIMGGNEGGYFHCPAVGDFNGDGKSDLVVIDYEEQKGFLLDGSVLSNGLSSIDMQTGIPGYSPPMFGGLPPLSLSGMSIVTGDFDGNGKADLFPTINEEVRGVLLSNVFGSPIVPPASFGFSVPFDASLGDVNGDGKQDLVVLPLGGPNGSVGIIFGYHPLDNPTIQVRGNPFLPKAVLDLRVEGDPTEMKLSGDILVPPPDIWIPYRLKIDATLTPSVGDKTITVVFRTKEGRESDTLSLSIPLALGEVGVSSITNLLKEGGRAQWGAHLGLVGHLKASVYSREGRLLRVLIDEEKEPGVYVLEWDGTNSEGQRVAPGIYTIVFDVGGRIDRARVLVK